jgi:hypothetical protein
VPFTVNRNGKMKSQTLHEYLFQQERKILIPSFRKDLVALNFLLSSDYYEIGASGRSYNKKEVLEILLNEDPSEIITTEFRATELSEKAILITYRTKRTLNDGISTEALRSSIWKLNENQWQIVFHQATKIHYVPETSSKI